MVQQPAFGDGARGGRTERHPEEPSTPAVGSSHGAFGESDHGLGIDPETGASNELALVRESQPERLQSLVEESDDAIGGLLRSVEATVLVQQVDELGQQARQELVTDLVDGGENTVALVAELQLLEIEVDRVERSGPVIVRRTRATAPDSAKAQARRERS